MTEETIKANPENTIKQSTPKREQFRKGALFFFGIILPVAALLTEVFFHTCSEMFFDPIPSIGHILLIAIVPFANLLTWLALRKEDKGHLTSLGVLNALAIGISFFYALLFIPVLPIALFGLIGILYFGIGLVALLPMSPLFAFISALRFRRQTRQKLASNDRVPGLWPGLVMALVLMMAASAPDAITKIGLRLAASENPKTIMKGIRYLRTFGDQDVMIRACYRESSDPMDLTGWLVSMGSSLTTKKARDIYFRVNGEVFNAKRPPNFSSGFRGRGRSMSDEFDWDEHQGGDTVAGVLRGLSLTDSRIDGVVNSDGAFAYMEWTMVFKNDSYRQREARAQIMLPPGAVVSRLTLWINGEEREAAFGARGRVKQAYQKVVNQRRDPVVVTTCGPDRIMVQCFPVPPNGGAMKIRFGITAPFLIRQIDAGVLILPRILEQNFRMAADKMHSVWLESDAALSSAVTEFRQEKVSDGRYAIRGELKNQSLNSFKTAISVTRSADNLSTWATDTVEQDGCGVLQVLSQKTLSVPDKIVIVIDGSKGMTPYLADIAAALETDMPTDKFAVLVADDNSITGSGLDAGPTEIKAAAKRIRNLKCEGGQDNTEALLQAWELAAQSNACVILWIHGPQGHLISEGEQLRQRFERRPDSPILYELQTEAGPNRLIEKMDGLRPIRDVARAGDFATDLVSLLQNWKATNKVWRAEYERRPLQNLQKENIKKSDKHLARLWAYNKIIEDYASGDKQRTERATAMGTRYNLVTPLTGAVVLETQEQYKEAQLEPADPTSVPTVSTVPEPEIWALMITALFLIVWVIIQPRLCRAK